MNLPKIPIGNTDFEQIRSEGFFFVDKSLFIEQILETNSKVMLFLRPRRFGKTLNLWMLRAFFEMDGVDRKPLFRGLQIENSPHFHLCGTKPIIFLSFKDLKGETWEHFTEFFVYLLKKETRRLQTIAEKISPENATQFDALLNLPFSDLQLKTYLENLCSLLSKIYHSRVIILIDEYDTPFQQAENKNYAQQLAHFFRIFFPLVLKDNPALEWGLLTGILRVAKESIFSGLNHLDVFDPTRIEFSSFFGFTEAEVIASLQRFQLSAHEQAVRDWYDGYRFGGLAIYNPWSILKFLNQKQLRPYWVETATVKEVGQILESSMDPQNRFLQCILQLAQGKPVVGRLRDDLSYRNFQSIDGILSLLTYAGYLACEPITTTDDQSNHFRIVNREVVLLFRDLAQNWVSGNSSKPDSKKELVGLLSKGDVKGFEHWLQQAILAGVSYYDYSRHQENFYHALLLGMTILLTPNYRVISNRESGFGRFDLELTPQQKDWPAYIIEIKYSKTANGQVEKSLEEALIQIEENDYASSLKNAGYSKIIKLALAFSGKRVRSKVGDA